MSLDLQGFNQAHPEIVNIPGSVQHQGYSHRSRLKQHALKQIKKVVFSD
jgi:hypothetical protein